MKTKIFISISCILLAVAHIIWPNIKVDITTLILVLIAILPWLAAVIRSVELPGGFKIELQDVKAATEKIMSGKSIKVTPQSTLSKRKENLGLLSEVAKTDPNLALVGLRIEIEKRLSQLANNLGIPTVRRSANVLLRDLITLERIDRETASGLGDLITLGNQAAHGAEVSSDAANWAIETGPLVLESLNNLIDDK
jgi:hypothetical protein